MERTLVLLKPDTIQRSFAGELITRFEKVGLKIVGMKMVWVDEEFSKKHYAAHIEKKFYPGLQAMRHVCWYFAVCRAVSPRDNDDVSDHF